LLSRFTFHGFNFRVAQAVELVDEAVYGGVGGGNVPFNVDFPAENQPLVLGFSDPNGARFDF
jgi:hypothetical protein